MPYFKQSIFEASQKRGDLTSKEYRERSRDEPGPWTRRGYRRHYEEGAFGRDRRTFKRTDVADRHGEWGLFFRTIGSSSPAAVASYPAITVPAGYLKELPIGVTFMGGAWSEGPLIRLAYAYEQATKARRAPRYLATYT